MAFELGCASDYYVAIHDRTGANLVGSFDDVTSVKWGRILDDTSSAEVVIGTAEPECCELVNQIFPWCHDLSIYRDEELVWQGPIVALDPIDRDSVTIKARDVTAWLDVRIIHNRLDFTAAGAGPADLVTIAQAIVDDALAPDDPNILITASLSGVLGERLYEADSEYSGTELRELARVGVDFTALGHRLILAGEVPFARTATLSDDDFAGGLNIVIDGLSMVSRAVVVGEGVSAESGGVGTCGLIERLIKEDAILDQASAQSEADSTVAAGAVPVYLEVPDGIGLGPMAPVSIAELVPGVVVPVATQDTCRTVAADLRLRRLDVTFDADNGERVAVSLVPLGATLD